MYVAGYDRAPDFDGYNFGKVRLLIQPLQSKISIFKQFYE